MVQKCVWKYTSRSVKDGVFHFKHNCFTILGCQTLWILSFWALDIFHISKYSWGQFWGDGDLGAVWSSQLSLFNDLLGMSGAVISVGLNYSPYLRRDLPDCLSSTVNYKFSNLTGGNKQYSQTLWLQGTALTLSLIFAPLRHSPDSRSWLTYSYEHMRGLSACFQQPLSVQVSWFWSSVLWTLATLVSWALSTLSQLKEWGSTWGSAWTLSRDQL